MTDSRVAQMARYNRLGVILISEINELQKLQLLVRELTTRVYRLERAAGIESAAVIAEPEAPQSSSSPPIPEPLPRSTHSTLIPHAQVRRASSVVETSDRSLESRIGSHWLN